MISTKETPQSAIDVTLFLLGRVPSGARPFFFRGMPFIEKGVRGWVGLLLFYVV
jgi:hypothetical protein